MSRKNEMDSVSVYSTEHGRLCPGCGRPPAQCVCRQQVTVSGDKKGGVRVTWETKGRKGSGVSLIVGLPLAESDLRQLAKQLKQRCGSGGTVKAGVVEIQGDHRDVLVEALRALGFQAKKAGG